MRSFVDIYSAGQFVVMPTQTRKQLLIIDSPGGTMLTGKQFIVTWLLLRSIQHTDRHTIIGKLNSALFQFPYDWILKTRISEVYYCNVLRTSLGLNWNTNVTQKKHNCDFFLSYRLKINLKKILVRVDSAIPVQLSVRLMQICYP